MFEAFPKLTRFSHDWVVTEKIDGTNAQIIIASALDKTYDELAFSLGSFRLPAPLNDTLHIFAGSRTRLLTPQSDNFGFASWVQKNALELFKLGEGRHFGEWAGGKIQRGYGLQEKTFALFDAVRWSDLNPDRPAGCTCVPLLAKGYMDNPAAEFDRIMEDLKANGSRFAPGFMNPEGIVMLHRPSGTLFKKTFEYDEAGKWAENQARKAA